MADEIFIQTKGLTKDFGKLRAVNNLNLSIRKGQTYGFLGPNGAGKSTTIRMLTGFLKPTTGSIEIMGMDMLSNPASVHERMGIVPDQFGFYPLLTADEHLKFYGKLYGMAPKKLSEQIDKIISMVGLDKRRDAKLREYSHGMKQRLAIGQALLNDPDLLFLDEPTTGLDPQGSYETRELIKELSKNGLTIFVSSHILPEIQNIATHVGIINFGQLICQDTIENIRANGSGARGIDVFIQTYRSGDLATILNGIDGVDKVETVAEKGFKVHVKDRDCIHTVSRKVAFSKLGLMAIYELRSSLEQVFLQLTGGVTS